MKNNNPVNESDEWYKMQLDNDPKISESSTKSYMNNIKHIISVCDNANINTILNNPNLYGGMIVSKTKSENSLKSYLSTILTFCRCSGLKENKITVYDVWYKKFNTVYQRIQNRIESNVPTDKQDAGFVEWETIIEKRKTFPLGSDQHVLLSIYTAIPPRRQKEYYAMKIYTDDNNKPELDHNQLYIPTNNKDAHIFICDHNTSKFKKTYLNEKVPDILVNTIKKSLIRNPRGYVFVNTRNKEPFKDNKSFQSYSNNMLKKIFDNESISVNTLRHSYASFIYRQPDLTYLQRKNIAEMMGHSVDRALKYVFIKNRNQAFDL